MIYEMRTYDLKPRSLPEVLKRWTEAYEKRRKLSELAAFWYTEIGPLNQIVHVWPYKDLEERGRIRAAALAAGGWPPKTAEFIVSMRSEIMIPWEGSPLLPSGDAGPIFEMRTYTINPGDQPKVQKAWAKALPDRVKLSPVIATWFSELGGLNKFVHVWPYKSLEQRMQVRQAAIASGKWPPVPDQGPDFFSTVSQENKILLAAPFSPLR
ncbi:MAG: NIPSNAP family protein [Burkholderiales bacterium]